MKNIYRIIDANINRAAEGIRVLEDLARFNFESSSITEKMRNLRHKLRKNIAFFDNKLLSSRNSAEDLGKEISQQTLNDRKTSKKQLIFSNFKRAQEALRTIEENLKILEKNDLSKEYEMIRFALYEIEKEFSLLSNKNIPEGIYGITAEKFSKGRKNIDVVREMIKGGIKILQYREKNKYKSFKELYEECREIRKITYNEGITFIVNDFIDIAMMVDADGVHIGQDDFPIIEVRNLIGNKIIGLSTHSPKQAELAIASGADYIGVGPIFSTQTKENVCNAVGLEYLDYAVENVKIPFIAIGGIKEHNISEIIRRGAKRICLVTEIVGADDIQEKIKRINEKISKKSRLLCQDNL